MASEFQRRKIAGVFAAMDANSDGFLAKDDFEALTARWTGMRGVEPGSSAHVLLSGIMMGWWAALLGASDRDRDGQVSLDEVLSLVDRLPAMLDVVAATANAMFEVVDENADGEISAAEYRQLIEAWTGRATDTDEIFARLDFNGDGHLSRTEFAGLWTEFWAGNTPEAPGTWTFGHFDLPTPAPR
ncbi:EF-hand domain-containing protein [Amycolatopsis sp. H20-H5]|uniref:EF-hand domain-containing protein n=1 Tax=Amycolatopsis sp. H20-H5 TaxID=3046309 RepID=UPI002DBE2094|nr:EF-hand domain-containing protein [Amycolatopsis sp. H20-H5]MEC3982376.1 EF-hand domain-containing protein [Amycolatopsis sp. H20-H5]